MTESGISVLVAVIAAAAAVTSGILSNFFTYYQLKRSSQQRISEFRKDWIEDLRNKISEYLSLAYRRTHIKSQFDIRHTFSPELWRATTEEMISTNEKFIFLTNYILLNLNRTESEHISLENKMEAIFKHDKKKIDQEPVFTELSRVVLKK